MPGIDELLKVLPFLGAGASGYMQGNQMRRSNDAQDAEQARQRTIAARSAEMFPVELQGAKQRNEFGAAAEGRAASEFHDQNAPVTETLPPELLKAIAAARSQAGAPQDPSAYGKMDMSSLTKSMSMLPTDPAYMNAASKSKAAQDRANNASDANSRHIDGLISHYEDLKDGLTKSIMAHTPIDALVEGRIRSNPEDAAILDANHGDAKVLIEHYDQKIRELEGKRGQGQARPQFQGNPGQGAPPPGAMTQSSNGAAAQGQPQYGPKNQARVAHGLPPIAPFNL